MSEEDKKQKPWWEDVKDRFRKLENNVSYMRGELDEMKRHNTRMIKVLIAIITALLGIICYLVKG